MRRERWVFGYGSLMWNPGFACEATEPAQVHGWHRALCVISHIYRGTPERPGLVLGLDSGGSCHGVAFRIAEGQWEETLAYLRAREQVTMVYREVTTPVRLLESHRKVEAVTYVVDHHHDQYAGHLTTQETADLVRRGIGKSGSCRDYVRNTVVHLQDLGIRDRNLEAVLRAAEMADQVKASES